MAAYEPYTADSWQVNSEVAMTSLAREDWPLSARVLIVPAECCKPFGFEDLTKYVFTSEVAPKEITLYKEVAVNGTITVRTDDDISLTLLQNLDTQPDSRPKAVVIAVEHDNKYVGLTAFPLSALGTLRKGDAITVSQAPGGLFNLC
jgi:hypothetical protein